MTLPTRKLKFVVRQINEKALYANTDLPYTGLEDIQSWTGRRVDSAATKPDGLVSLFKKGDVLFGKLRPYLAKVLLAEEDGASSTEALVLRCEKDLSPAFLKYVLLESQFIAEVNASTFGAKMPRASWRSIGGTTVPLPGLATQEAVAAYLDQKTSWIDQLITKRTAQARLLAEREKQHSSLSLLALVGRGRSIKQ